MNLRIKFYGRGSTEPVSIDVPNDIVQIEIPSQHLPGTGILPALFLHVGTEMVVVNTAAGERVDTYDFRDAVVSAGLLRPRSRQRTVLDQYLLDRDNPMSRRPPSKSTRSVLRTRPTRRKPRRANPHRCTTVASFRRPACWTIRPRLRHSRRPVPLSRTISQRMDTRPLSNAVPSTGVNISSPRMHGTWSRIFCLIMRSLTSRAEIEAHAAEIGAVSNAYSDCGEDVYDEPDDFAEPDV